MLQTVMSDAVVKSVLLMGKGALAIQAGQWFVNSSSHQLKLLVPVTPEPSWSDSVATWARHHEVDVLESGDWRDVAPSFAADLLISIYYHQILSAEFIGKCGRALNLHNGPLPRYRGMSPINWALKNGEPEHGVTLHEMTSEIDAGPIIAQRLFAIDPQRDEVIDVYERCLEHGWLLLKDALPRLDTLIAKPQDETEATYHSAGENKHLGERRYFTREEHAPRDDL